MTLVEFVVHCGVYLQADIGTYIYTRGLVVVDKPTLLGFGRWSRGQILGSMPGLRGGFTCC
ncbi:hypothetical protein Hanom_Chr01g00000771 [Helianthus anomalus]